MRTKNGKFDAGTDADVTASSDFQLGTFWQQPTDSAPRVVSLTQASIITICVLSLRPTKTPERTFNGPARDGKEALTIPTNGDGVQGYKLHILYKHK